MSASIVTACKQATVKKAQSLLREKYSEDFVVDRMGNGSISGSGYVYSAFCRPSNGETDLFEVWINEEGTVFKDKYKEALVAREMKNEAEDLLLSISGDYAMLVDITGIVDGYEKGTKIKELTENVSGYVVLAMSIDDEKNIAPTHVYSTMEQMYRNWKNIKGGLFLYLVDKDTLNEIKDCMEVNPRIDSTLFNVCGEGFITDAESTGLSKSQEEMELELY